MADLIDLALIDDDEAVLDALLHYLTRQSVKTSCFNAAKSFLTTLNHGARFDCVVSDVRMPGMSGLDLMRHLNERACAQQLLLKAGLQVSFRALIMRLELHRHPNQLGKIASADALHHPSPMALDCSGTNVEFDCDLLTGKPNHCKLHHLPLTR